LDRGNFKNYLIKFLSNEKCIGDYTIQNFLIIIESINLIFANRLKKIYFSSGILDDFIIRNYSSNKNEFNFVSYYSIKNLTLILNIIKKILLGSIIKKNFINKKYEVAVLDSYEINKPVNFFSKSNVFKKILFLTNQKNYKLKNIFYIYNFCSISNLLFVLKIFFLSILKFKKFNLINVLYVQFKFDEEVFYLIFRKFGVKKFLTSSIVQIYTSSAVSAIEKNNGFAYGFTTSFSEDYSSHHNIDAYHYFFSFNNCNYLKIKNSKLKKIFHVGYYGDYKFKYKTKKSIILKKKLKLYGMKYIIGFFDQGYTVDSMFQMGYNISDAGYNFLLKKILSEKYIALIIKPKKPGDLYKKLSQNTQKILRKAIMLKKCILIDKTSKSHVKNFDYTPSLIAMASNITIHDTLLAGTAALESALVGRKSIMFDYYGTTESLFDKGNLNIVYRDWELLWSEILKDKNKQGNKNINLGDWSSIINKFDPYMDGKANQRIIDILFNEKSF
jgi:hypothetical protein